jgi:hypothetical protein
MTMMTVVLMGMMAMMAVVLVPAASTRSAPFDVSSNLSVNLSIISK